jgi:hypothetical protein
MIQNSSASAYPSPLSPEMLKDYHQLLNQRIAATEQVIKSSNEKMQKNIDPELTKIFNTGAKSLIDLYA